MSQTLTASTLATTVNRAAEGDPLACEDLCRLVYPSMQRWLQGMIRERHPDVKADLTAEIAQEAWLVIQRKIGQFRGDCEAAFLGWCYRVTFATCKNYLKKYVRVSHREEATEEPIEPTPRHNDDPKSQLLRQERLAAVREAIENIRNAKHRQALVLFFFEDMSQKEIAETMGATESAISTWVYRAKADVEEYLTMKGFGQ